MKADLSLYLVTDAALAAAQGHDLVDLVVAAVEAGVTAVQVREKRGPAHDLLATVLALAEALPEEVALIVNDRVDVYLGARAAGARVSGVHVGQSDLAAGAVRRLVGTDALVGLSAATASELSAAGAGGVDYVGIGVVRATRTKPDAPAPLGVEGFAGLAATTSLPAVAIGGILPSDMGPLRRAGAAGAAVVSGICDVPDPGAAVRRYVRGWAASA